MSDLTISPGATLRGTDLARELVDAVNVGGDEHVSAALTRVYAEVSNDPELCVATLLVCAELAAGLAHAAALATLGPGYDPRAIGSALDAAAAQRRAMRPTLRVVDDE